MSVPSLPLDTCKNMNSWTWKTKINKNTEKISSVLAFVSFVKFISQLAWWTCSLRLLMSIKFWVTAFNKVLQCIFIAIPLLLLLFLTGPFKYRHSWSSIYLASSSVTSSPYTSSFTTSIHLLSGLPLFLPPGSFIVTIFSPLHTNHLNFSWKLLNLSCPPDILVSNPGHSEWKSYLL